MIPDHETDDHDHDYQLDHQKQTSLKCLSNITFFQEIPLKNSGYFYQMSVILFWPKRIEHKFLLVNEV